MTTLLECREWMRQFYGKFSLYVKAGIRFLTGLTVFFVITYRMGYMTQFKNPVIPLVFSLICTFLPINFMIVFAIVMLMMHLYALSMEIALVMLCVFLALYLLYYRFSPKYGFVLLLTPVAYVLGIPYAIPVALGLIATPITVIPVAVGSIVYYMLYYIYQYGTNITGAGTTENVQKVVYVFANALKDPGLYLHMITLAAALFLVYFIRKLSIDNAWLVAIISGAVGQLVFMLIGNFALDISISIVGIIIGTILSGIIALILRFFVFNVDYSRTEYVQFEDDEYVYYVKAVPKITITKREKTITRINAQRRRGDGTRTAGRFKPDDLL